jgi:hypothetical protein
MEQRDLGEHGAAEALAALRRAAGEVAVARAGHDLDAVRRLMRAVYQIGLAARRDPAFGASAEVRGAVAETTPPLVRGVNVIAGWQAAVEDRLTGTWEWDWEEACEARSGLALLLDLYRDSPLADDEGLEPEELDRLLRHVAQFEGWMPDEAVPAGIPASHWWWWAPQPPPPHRAQ